MSTKTKSVVLCVELRLPQGVSASEAKRACRVAFKQSVQKVAKGAIMDAVFELRRSEKRL